MSARFDDWGGLIDAGSAYAFVYANGVWTQQAKLTASDAATSDQLRAVALSGNTIITGAALANGPTGANSGAAYAFERSGVAWSQIDRLVGARRNHAFSRNFGNSVSISGDTAVVGVQTYDPALPGAYVYERDGNIWRQDAALVSAGDLSDYMGASVSIDGDTIAVGEPGNSKGGPFGQVEIFLRYEGAWFSQIRLAAQPTGAFDRFGHSVALDGDRLAVGAPQAGQAFVFGRTLTSWEQLAMLTTDEPTNFLGESVAVSGSTMVAGAPLTVVADATVGSAYVLVESDGEWIEQQQLTAFDGADTDNFGYAVAISGETILVGSEQGGYVFTRENGVWTLQAKLTADGFTVDPVIYAYVLNVDEGVALDGDVAILGSPGTDFAVTNDGSAFVFNRSGTTWTQGTALRPVLGDEYMFYGHAVAIDGSNAIVSAIRQPGADVVGAANIYRGINAPP